MKLILEWIVYFIIYCFLGWCFETTYVSLKVKRYINRGFMVGPYLPIYGFGAISVILFTKPFEDNVLGVYIGGALFATFLEYVTGVLMEKIFKVRYWDYSTNKFQYKGRICLSSTLAWGALSVAAVFGLQRFVIWGFSLIPEVVHTVLAFLLIIIMSADFAWSFRTAIELKDFLDKFSGMKEEVKKIQKRIEDLETAILDETVQKKERFVLEIQEMRLKQKIYTERIKDKFEIGKQNISMLRRNPDASSSTYKTLLEEIKDKIKNQK